MRGESLGRILQRLQLRHVALGGIVEREPALVAQLEDRHRGEALRHRRDAEHRVRLDRRLGGDVAKAGRADVRELAVDDHAPGRAGDVLARDEVAKGLIDGRKRSA